MIPPPPPFPADWPPGYTVTPLQYANCVGCLQLCLVVVDCYVWVASVIYDTPLVNPIEIRVIGNGMYPQVQFKYPRGMWKVISVLLK